MLPSGLATVKSAKTVKPLATGNLAGSQSHDFTDCQAVITRLGDFIIATLIFRQVRHVADEFGQRTATNGFQPGKDTAAIILAMQFGMIVPFHGGILSACFIHSFES